MRESLDETDRMIVDGAAASIASTDPARRLRAICAGTPLCDDGWHALARDGWLGVMIPEALGGAGLGLRQGALVARAFGRLAVPEPFVTCVMQPSAALGGIGAASARAVALARALAGGETRISVAMQAEAGQGRPGAASVAADTDGDGTVLRGRAIGVPEADSYLVHASRGGCDLLVAVAGQADGLSVTAQPMVDGTRLCRLDFDNLRCATADILAQGDAAAGAVDAAWQAGMIGAAHLLEGICQAVLDIVAEHLKTRRQFGVPLAGFQALRHRVAEMAIQHELAAAANRAALADCTTGAEVTGAVHAAKARASAAARSITREAVQLHGAIGYSDEARIGLYLNLALRWSGAFGGADRHRQLFAKSAAMAKLVGA